MIIKPQQHLLNVLKADQGSPMYLPHHHQDFYEMMQLFLSLASRQKYYVHLMGTLPGFRKATRVGILLGLGISLMDISLNCIATAHKLCLPVKHSMFHRQTKL